MTETARNQETLGPVVGQGEGTSNASESRQADPTVINPGPSIQANSLRRSSSTTRLVSGWLCLLCATGFAVTLQGAYGEEPRKLFLIVSALIAVAGVIIESFRVAPQALSSRRALSLVPLAGVMLVTASSLSLLSTTGAEISTLAVVAPLLAVATLLFGRAVALRGAALSRLDSDYLFPLGRRIGANSPCGTVLEIRAGHVLSVDARIDRGSVAVDERVLTTVPAFKVREEGDVLYAGSEVLAGEAEATALTSDSDSSLAQLQTALQPMIEGAGTALESEDAGATRATVLGFLFLAAAAAIFWNERTPGYETCLLAAGAILLGASICQVSSYLYGRRRALVLNWLARGYVFGSAGAAKQLAAVSRVVFDQSRVGEGSRYQIAHFEVLDDRLSKGALCDILASLLGRAESADLAAAGGYCRWNASKLSVERVLELREYPGRGICGTVHGIELSVGNEDFLVERGIMVQPADGASTESDADRLLLVAIDDDVVARFSVTTSQEFLIESEDRPSTLHGIDAALSSGVAQHLGSDTLLVRGPESDLVGQTGSVDLSLFTPQSGEIRPSTIVALSNDLTQIDRLVADCARDCRIVERTRILLGFSGLVLIASVFSGLITPVIPLVLLGLVCASLRLS